MNIVQRFLNKSKLRTARQSNKQLNVVITGGSRGLGRAMCERFLQDGDRVTMICRNPRDVQGYDNLVVIEKDVMDVTSELFDHKVDLWINNAAVSGSYRRFMDQSDDKVREVLKTNLIGAALCSKRAFEIMSKQPDGGAIFNMTGAGANGFATPDFSLYGASKAGVVQLTKSLQVEWKDTNIDIHVVSPGMMNTELLLDNLPDSVYKVVSYFCTDPQVVAPSLVEAMKETYYNAEDNAFINYMTLQRVIKKVIDRK